MTPRRAFPAIGMAAGVLASLVLAEGILRAWVWAGVPRSNGFIRFMKAAEHVPSRGPLFRPSADPALGIECVPNSRRGHVRINSWGFRGAEVAERPADGVVRVAVVGDSETFGAALPEDKTLPGCLATALEAAAGAKRYEVLNLGVPGYNTLQELRVVEARLPRLHPQVAILYYVLNDAELTPRTVLLHSGGLRSLYLPLLASYVSKARWPADIRRLRRQMTIVDYYQHLHSSEYFETVKNMLREMAAVLDRRGVRFILVVAPEIYEVRGFKRYPYRDVHARLRSLAARGLEVVDPLDRLAANGKRPREYWVSKGDPHKNEEANRVIAAAVAEAVVRPEAIRP